MDWRHPADPLLLVLAPYFQTVTPDDLVPIAEELYEHAPRDKRDMLLAALLALGQHKFGSIEQVIEAILEKVGKLMDVILEAIADSSIGRALKAEGLAEGEAKGLAVGEALTRHTIVARFWAKRFNQPIDAALMTHIVAMPQARFEQLIDLFIDATPQDQILTFIKS